jgi:hypothetical protein
LRFKTVSASSRFGRRIKHHSELHPEGTKIEACRRAARFFRPAEIVALIALAILPRNANRPRKNGRQG